MTRDLILTVVVASALLIGIRGCEQGANVAVAMDRAERADSALQVAQDSMQALEGRTRAAFVADSIENAALADTVAALRIARVSADARAARATERAQSAAEAHAASLDSAQAVGFAAYRAEVDTIIAAKDATIVAQASEIVALWEARETADALNAALSAELRQTKGALETAEVSIAARDAIIAAQKPNRAWEAAKLGAVVYTAVDLAVKAVGS